MRIACAMLIVGAACGRGPGPVVAELIAVTTTASAVVPRMTIDVFVQVRNNGADPLRLIDAEVVTDAPELHVVRGPLWPEEIAPGTAVSLRFVVTLPREIEGLVVDARATLADQESLIALNGAQAPLDLGALVLTASDTDLVVSTEIDETVDPALDDPNAAGPELSLREAVTIANNRGGPDVVAFDPGVFPATAPGTVVVDHDIGELAFTDAGITVDGSDRGVVLQSDIIEYGTVFFVRAANVTLRHLSLRNSTPALVIEAASCTLDQVRLEAIAYPGSSNQHMLVAMASNGLTIANSFVGGGLGNSGVIYLSIGASSNVLIADTDIDYVSRAILLSSVSDSEIRGLRGSEAASFVEVSMGRRIIIRDSRLHWSAEDCIALYDNTDDSLVADNELSDCGIDSSSRSHIAILEGSRGNSLRRNTMSGGDVPIYIELGTQDGVLPPVVASADTVVSGGAPGTPDGSVIDVFADPGARASVFVGETTVAGGSWSLTLASALESGANVTATVTLPGGSTSALSAPAVVP